jgi:ketosteroid isomerase-like protein
MHRFLAAGVLLLLSMTAAFAGAKEEMLATDRAFSAMSVREGAHAAFLAYMTDDVRLFDGDNPPILGKEAAAAYYADIEKKNPNGQKNSTLEWAPLEAEASPDGVLGWTRGTWTFTGTKADGTILKVTGYYVTEWRRGRDRKYRFILDIGGAYGA